MQTIPQDETERVVRPTTSIRVYESSVVDLMQLQVEEYRRTESKPTQAEIIERALEMYKSKTPEGCKGGRK